MRSFSNGGAAIDIREVYTDKNGEQRPGKGKQIKAVKLFES